MKQREELSEHLRQYGDKYPLENFQPIFEESTESFKTNAASQH